MLQNSIDTDTKIVSSHLFKAHSHECKLAIQDAVTVNRAETRS